jgi:hypothetical protein
MADPYGLPVYTSKWLPGQMLVGGPRFGKTLTVNEFRRLHLNDFEDEMPLYDNYTVSNSSTLTNVIYTSNGTGSITQWPSVSGDAYWYSPPEPALPKVPKPETDMAWLKRRVAEVSWVPA